MKQLSLCDKCRWQGWYTSIFNNYIPKRSCIAFHDNSKEEPMKFCSDYTYSRRTEKMYIDYYKEKENGKD